MCCVLHGRHTRCAAVLCASHAHMHTTPCPGSHIRRNVVLSSSHTPISLHQATVGLTHLCTCSPTWHSSSALCSAARVLPALSQVSIAVLCSAGSAALCCWLLVLGRRCRAFKGDAVMSCAMLHALAGGPHTRRAWTGCIASCAPLACGQRLTFVICAAGRRAWTG